jgi:hypothetical protein
MTCTYVESHGEMGKTGGLAHIVAETLEALRADGGLSHRPATNTERDIAPGTPTSEDQNDNHEAL